MCGIKFEIDDFHWVKAVDEDGGSIKTQSVEAHLMLAILNKLEEIRCGNIDIEDAIEKQKP